MGDGMQYLRTLVAITQDERELAGQRALDLALLHQNKFPTPHTAVILSTAFDTVIKENNLKYKIDYILGFAKSDSSQSMTNAYTSARKALMDAKLPHGFEAEVQEIVDSLTSPSADLTAKTEDGSRPPLRLILSYNISGDPEETETVIQVVKHGEIIQAIREAWAIVYHPTQLSWRMSNKISESRLKVAILLQVMDSPEMSVHAYSCVPQDHQKIYLQTYHGYTDLRDKIVKDYYAIVKRDLSVVSRDVKNQPTRLQRDKDGELSPHPFQGKTEHDRLIDREAQEFARLAKKAERTLGSPVKLFFTRTNDRIATLWCNRLGFDIILDADDATL